MNLNDLIGASILTATINSPAIGLPKVFDEKFFSTRNQVSGDVAYWDVTPITQQTPKAVSSDSPAASAPKTADSMRSATLPKFFEFHNHKEDILRLLNSSDPAAQKRGKAAFTRQILNFNTRLNNAEIAMVASALRHGAIYLDSAGNILPTSSGAARTIDLQVPATHKNQCDSAISASWATDSTDIFGDINTILKRMAQNGRPCKKIMYGSSIPGYISSNDVVELMMARSGLLADELMQNRIPKGFGDDQKQVVWEPLQQSFYADSSGTIREWFAGDNLLFLPEVDSTWYTMLEGSSILPDETGVISDEVDSAANGMPELFGKFSYAVKNHNPTGIQHFVGHKALPVFLDPNAFYIADVVA